MGTMWVRGQVQQCYHGQRGHGVPGGISRDGGPRRGHKDIGVRQGKPGPIDPSQTL